MMRIALLVLALASGAPALGASCPTLLASKVTTMLGETADLCEHAGKVLLVVNTASLCGYTPQYKGLQALHQRYESKGLVILGFPSNDFGKQEPGSNKEIADFCDRTYAVKFEMFGKTSVGPGASPLFDALATATRKRPEWNFHKYLVARDGKSVASFASDVDPESRQFVAKLEQLLGAK